jgi:hypothetical protein
VAAAARIANGSDMVDVDAKPETVHALAIHTFGLGHHGLGAQLR